MSFFVGIGILYNYFYYYRSLYHYFRLNKTLIHGGNMAMQHKEEIMVQSSLYEKGSLYIRIIYYIIFRPLKVHLCYILAWCDVDFIVWISISCPRDLENELKHKKNVHIPHFGRISASHINFSSSSQRILIRFYEVFASI